MQTRLPTQRKAPPTAELSDATGLNDPGLLAPLSTPFDAAESPLTLATPSCCCCCCCCCLATIVSAQTYLVSEVHYNAKENNQPRWLPMLTFASPVVAFYASLLFGARWGPAVAPALWVLFVFAALRRSGHTWLRALGTVVALAVATAVLLVVEFFAFIATLGIATLILTPLGAWGAWKLAKANHGPYAPIDPPTTADDGWPLEPPSADAIAFPFHPIDPRPRPTVIPIDPEDPDGTA